MKKLTQKGFTIIELLIASLIFTTILLLCLEGITRLGKIYIKNTSTSRTSQFIKAFTDEVSRQIKYGSSMPLTLPSNIDNSYRFCVSGNAYKIIFNNINDAIKRKQNPGCGTSIQGDFFDTGAENIAPNGMRVLTFSISESESLWSVNILVALGDNDLLTDADGNTLSEATPYDQLTGVKCRSGISGGEFCSVLGISSYATRRLE